MKQELEMGHFSYPSEPVVRQAAKTNKFIGFKKEEVEGSICQRFEFIASQHAEQLAIKTKNYQLTYDMVNRLANRVARAILAQRGGGQEPVALLFDHDAPIITALLGVLKAGKAYVALEPAYPQARLNYILEDLQNCLILTDTQNLALADKLAQGKGQIINLDGLDPNLPDQNVGLSIAPTALAGIFYTSGSTGSPKGVERDHRHILHRTWLETNYDHISPADHISLLYSCGFGASVADIFNALLNGATLCLYNVREAGLSSLANWLVQEEISLFHLPVALFRQFLDTLTDEEQFPHLRQVIPSGQLYKSDVERCRNHIPADCILISRMASSETGMISRLMISRQTVLSSNVVPVGYPVADKKILILDETGQPAGINRVGEIAVKSRYLSPGYWGKPELTQQAFLPAPDGGDERIYRMGDLGRLLPDGCLEFLGRKDFQIKIRGYRVELSEVEAALHHLSLVKEAVVVVQENPADEPAISSDPDRRLVAYIVPANYPPPTTSELRTALAEILPDYMIPALFMMLDELPLTANGKLDYSALPHPSRSRPELANDFVPAQTPLEEKLVEIWSQVLDVERVGIHDNFLDLGGHSLLATQLVARVVRTFQVELSPRALLETATVATMAAAISRNGTGKHQAETGAPTIPRREASELAPLSFAQQRLWLINQFEPNVPMYNMPKVLQLKGTLNLDALQQALDGLVARHEILRTTIGVYEGQPVQLAAQAWSVPLPIINLSNWPPAKREVELQCLLNDEIDRPFDLARDLMIRATLFQLSSTEHILLLVTHHIATDYTSTGILFRELSLLYEAFSKGEAAALPELPVQYADFAVWQRQWLQGETLQQQLDYWQNQLGGELPVLNLPTDRPRPPVQTYHGVRQLFTFPQPLAEALHELARQEQVTLFMTLLAAFKVLLYRYTNQEDLSVGSTISGRKHVETEGLIGFFINTLVLRADLSGQPTFRQLLARVRQVTLAAYAHQDLPFEKVVEVLQPQRDLSRPPLFQVMFDFLSTAEPVFAFPNLTVRRLEIDNRKALFDLTLHIREKAGQLTGIFEYNTDLFSGATIKRMMGHFQTLLEGIIANPDTPIAHLPLLTQAEQQQLLVEWNDTNLMYPPLPCLHHLFEVQVKRTPEAIALSFEGQQMTYRELNSRANQLAHYLQQQGVGPEVLVGMCVERSMEMVIGLLGILKAGGAYLPLDPAYPQERLAFMLADSQTPLVLTQQKLVKRLPNSGAQLICLDKDWPAIAQESQQNLVSGCIAANLAYVIYTSGSTGKPKGVLVSHYNVVRLFQTTQAWFHFSESDVWTLFHSYAFDFSVWELWGALLYGGRLVIIPYWTSRSPQLFYELLSREQVTVLNQTPSAFRQLILVEETAQSRQPLALRLVIFGGEALDLQSLKPWFDRHGDQFPQLVNMYGITETTVHATYRPLTMRDLIRAPGSVIGIPIPDLQLYILDQQLQPVPIGVPGEIYVGGAGVARGYLNRPELTATKFIPIPPSLIPPHPPLQKGGGEDTFSHPPSGRGGENTSSYPSLLRGGEDTSPHPSLPRGGEYTSSHPPSPVLPSPHAPLRRGRENTSPLNRGDGARLYRSGDLARYLPNRDIEYLGRIDHQVKIRGFRIEVGEIETILGQHPAVQENVVLMREDTPGDPRLVAYIISSPGSPPPPGTLRDFLKQKLPDYMIPAAFVFLNTLPLTPNGKLDQKALPRPDYRPEPEAGVTAPRNELELQLAKIWEQLLNLQPIGITDNFFELGGHSLLAVRLATQIEKTFDKKLPLAALFQAPTIEQLALMLREERESTSTSSLVTLNSNGSKPPFFCIPGNLGNVFTDLGHLARHLPADQPFYGLQDGPQNPANIEALATHYLQEVRSVQPQGPYLLGGICLGGSVAFEMAHQLQAQGQAVALLALIEPPRPMNANPVQLYLKVSTFILERLVRRFGHHYGSLSQLRLAEKKSYATLKRKLVANVWAVKHYTPRPYSGHVHLFLTSESLKEEHDPRLDWGKLALNGLALHEIPGNHNTITGNNDTKIEESHMRVLAEQLQVCIDQTHRPIPTLPPKAADISW